MNRTGTPYEVYQSVFQLNAPLPKQAALLTALMGAETESWRVVGVTVAVLERLKPHGFKRAPNIRIERAHIAGRRDIAKFFFCREEPLTKDEFKRFFNALDRTVLVAPGEHRTNIDNLEVIPFELDAHFYFKCLPIAYEHNDEDAALLEEVHHELAQRRSSLVEARTLIPSDEWNAFNNHFEIRDCMRGKPCKRSR